MKRTTKTALIALIAAGAVGATTLSASAFGGPRGGMERGGFGGGKFMQMEFADLDADKSGLITVEDLQANARLRFDAADANKDGQLDSDEMAAQAKARMDERMKAAEEAGRSARRGAPDAETIEKRMGWMIEEMLDRRDTDKNGTLSFDEVSPDQARLDRMIDRFDTDDDNAISAAEFDAAQKEMWMRGKGRGGQRGHGDRGGLWRSGQNN
ncbi:hypothetical protein [Aliiroseovarius sp.]|uniref:EF-hand domain-containing protein n=1 Tax=Aliiroseovarius sp. TaxID=1872442 RepID=UPI002630C234|nr:hypothetical protein [Aliiroseovarius sp.]